MVVLRTLEGTSNTRKPNPEPAFRGEVGRAERIDDRGMWGGVGAGHSIITIREDVPGGMGGARSVG